MNKRKTLREAKDAGDLESFIKEHENDPPGDMDKLDEALRRSGKESGRKSKPAPAKK